jgi:hypothetical protein
LTSTKTKKKLELLAFVAPLHFYQRKVNQLRCHLPVLAKPVENKFDVLTIVIGDTLPVPPVPKPVTLNVPPVLFWCGC